MRFFEDTEFISKLVQSGAVINVNHEVFAPWRDTLNKILFEWHKIDCSTCLIEGFNFTDEELVIKFSGDRFHTFSIPCFILKHENAVLWARKIRIDENVSVLTERLVEIQNQLIIAVSEQHEVNKALGLE